jgi:hypothetical protein
MSEKPPSCLAGLLSMERLFIGSKSEGLYPVLHADDGRQYRLHRKADISLDERTLSNYDGKRVEVIGQTDNLRGHWRLVLIADTFPRVLEVAPMQSNVRAKGTAKGASDPIPTAIGKVRPEAVVQGLVQAQTAAKDLRSKE